MKANLMALLVLLAALGCSCSPEKNFRFRSFDCLLDGGSLCFIFKLKTETMAIVCRHGFGVKESEPHRYDYYTDTREKISLIYGVEIMANSKAEGEIIAQLLLIKRRDKDVAQDIDCLIECLKNRKLCPYSFEWKEFFRRRQD